MDYLSTVRQYRVGSFALFDTVVAYVGIFLLAPLLTKLFLKEYIAIPRASWMWLMLPISVVFHLIFSQNTPFMKMLVNPQQLQFYMATIMFFAMTYMGIRGIKKL